VTFSLVTQVLLFALSAALPLWGLANLYFKTRRDASFVEAMSSVITNGWREGDDPLPYTVEADAAAKSMRSQKAYAGTILAKRVLAARHLEDLILIGAGLACASVASIWSLVEAAL
jgi:hypothetical protein